MKKYLIPLLLLASCAGSKGLSEKPVYQRQVVITRTDKGFTVTPLTEWEAYKPVPVVDTITQYKK